MKNQKNAQKEVKDLAVASAQEKETRANKTMELVNEIMKDANCSFVVRGTFIGKEFNPEIVVQAN